MKKTKQVVLPLSMPPELYEEIGKASQKVGMNRSVFIRQCIRLAMPRVMAALTNEVAK